MQAGMAPVGGACVYPPEQFSRMLVNTVSQCSTVLFRHTVVQASCPWHMLADNLAAAGAVSALPGLSSVYLIRRQGGLGRHAVERVFCLDNLSGDYRGQFSPQAGGQLLDPPPGLLGKSSSE